MDKCSELGHYYWIYPRPYGFPKSICESNDTYFGQVGLAHATTGGVTLEYYIKVGSTIEDNNGEYYKVQIGQLEELPRTILADKWRRITFLYTTGEYLLDAETVNDLVVNSEERQILWKALRERLVKNQKYQAAEVEEVPLEDEVLSQLLGIKELREKS